MTTNTTAPAPYNLKNLRSTRGCEGQGFTAALYKGDTKIGDVADWGTGGGANVRVHDAAERDTFFAWAKALPPEPSQYGDLPMSGGFWAELQANRYFSDQQIKRHCKTKVCFRLKGDTEGTFRTLKPLQTDGMRALILHVRDKHGDKIEVIYNEDPRFQSSAKSSKSAGSATHGFRKGDKVEFTNKGATVQGVVSRVNKKRLTVDPFKPAFAGQYYLVPPTALRKVA